MGKTNTDILTTAEAAKLLGVSIRTAQLLIEGGTVPSWKTPGGHRRVYRADIEALIDGPVSVSHPPSANVVVVSSSERAVVYSGLFVAVPECTADIFDDPNAALFAIGSVRPHAILIDLEDAEPRRFALLQSLAANPLLGQSLVIAVGATGESSRCGRSGKVVHADDPAHAVATLRRSVADVREVLIPHAGEAFPIALNEGQRLVALERSGLLDTPPEEAFDRVTWLAAQTLDAPISLITMLTSTRQWFKSRLGIDLVETPRSWAFCNHTILQKGVFSVENLAGDPRFAENPAVAGDAGFRFYAGAPILDSEGFAVGSLCVIDHKPRTLSDREAQTLSALAALGSSEVRLRGAERRLRETLRQAERLATPASMGRSHATHCGRGAP